MKKIAAATLLSVFIAARALAADGGFYVAADAGAVDYSNAKVTGGGGVSYKSPGSVRISGGYRFSPYLGVEAGHSIFGKSEVEFSNATTTLEMSVIQVAAVGSIPIGDMFALFGKLGMASIWVEETGTGVAAGLDGSDVTTNPMIGLGGRFNINRHFSIRMQYEDFGKAKYTPAVFGVPQPEASIGVSVFSVGGVYHF